MKIRIRENTLRFRLTQEEVATLRDGEALESRTEFGAAPEQQMVWRVQVGTGTELTYNAGITSLAIPRESWLEENLDGDDGMQSTVPLDGGREIHVTVERDYRCLAPRDPAEDAGSFPHPDQGVSC